MEDYLVRALAYGGKIRAIAARTTETVGEAQRRHDTLATATAALGRAMTAGVMMGSMMKGDSRLTIKIEGGGPIGAIIVDANTNGEVRGYVSNPHVHFGPNEQGKLDVARAVGKSGTLTVVKDLGLKEKFSGQVPLVSGELGEDFTYYFAASEQVPSAVGLGVLVNPDHSVRAAGGFILQVMPETPESVVADLENRIKGLPPVSTMIEKGVSPEDLLKKIAGEGELKFLERFPVRFACSCSKEKFKDAMISLGGEELQSIIDEDGFAETQCRFCNEKYFFNREELEEMKAAAQRKKQ
ncbi:Hsp33 family molecular chaperone HslO [Caldibacillus debilis]|uniref:Hsp33 family molecular chaperone HslO n=1 Tax=Caldibacillus debilis TaxID=301148 RepID=UPI000B5664E7|nr:Hsp33 family molecular chaperone HslO [Caldibacillus debilis]OUM86498.1 MAG: Hsp33 family molecular chaperone [Caldibacillus debilis]